MAGKPEGSFSPPKKGSFNMGQFQNMPKYSFSITNQTSPYFVYCNTFFLYFVTWKYRVYLDCEPSGKYKSSFSPPPTTLQHGANLECAKHSFSITNHTNTHSVLKVNIECTMIVNLLLWSTYKLFPEPPFSPSLAPWGSRISASCVNKILKIFLEKS